MRVLIASSNEKSTAILERLVKEAGMDDVVHTPAGADARVLFGTFDILIINSPLADGSGARLATEAVTETQAGVIMILPADSEMTGRLEKLGILVVEKPLSRQMFAQSLKLAAAAHKRIAGLKSENDRLIEQLAEIRLIDRAKCALIQYLRMTEPQAHRFIEKQAMDLRRTKAQIAKSILKTYE